MSKDAARRALILAVLFVVFSVIAFFLPFEKNMVFWISYVFGIIAIAFQMYIFNVFLDRGPEIKSKFYGFPIARVGAIYLGVQLVLSLIQMMLAHYIPTWLSMIINILPIAFGIIGTIAADAAREQVIEQDVLVKTNVSIMKSLSAEASSLIELTEDADLRKQLENMADEFRYSDPVSNDETTSYEAELGHLLNELKNALMNQNTEEAKQLCDKVLKTLKIRNQICKGSK